MISRVIIFVAFFLLSVSALRPSAGLAGKKLTGAFTTSTYSGESIYSSLVAQSSSGGPSFLLVSTYNGFGGSANIYSSNLKNFNNPQVAFDSPVGVNYLDLISVGDGYVYGLASSFIAPVVFQLELSSNGTLTQISNYSAASGAPYGIVIPDATRGAIWFLGADRDDSFLTDLYTLTLSTGEVSVMYRNFTQGSFEFGLLGITTDGSYIIMSARAATGDISINVYDTVAFELQDKLLPDYFPVIAGTQTLSFRNPVGGGAQLLSTDYSTGSFGPALQFNQSITLSPYFNTGAIYAAGTNSVFISTLNTAFNGNTIYQVSYGSSSTAPRIMSAAAAPYFYFSSRTFAKIMVTPNALFAQDVYTMARFPLA